MAQGNNIKVVARFRPQNALEIREGGTPVIEIHEDTTVSISTQENIGPFTFDRAFGTNTSQQELYDYSIKQTLSDVFNGYNGTVFAYGQTGSGKTFTMMGSDIDDGNLKGITPRIVEGIFNNILESPPSVEYLVKVSYIEIYMEKVKDLLNPVNDNLPLHEDKNRGVYVKGLMEIFVSSVEEVYDVMKQGGKSRVIAQTNMNAESSRSHSIFQITIQMKNTNDGKTKFGNLFLVDLAGSEKVGKTGATGQTLEEAKKINKSLSSLGNVINSLTDKKSTHIPYRDSKLTRILQESLGGNSRTTLIINCSPSSYNVAETISTLRFGTRAKSIENKATINQALSPEELKNMVKKLNTKILSFGSYIKSLESELEVWRGGNSVPTDNQIAFIKNFTKDIAPQADSSPKPTQPQPKAAPSSSDTLLPAKAIKSPISQFKPDSSVSDADSSRPESPMSAQKSFGDSPDVSSADLPLNELLMRPMTPYTMGEDERDEFLKRENDLTDQEQVESLRTKNDTLGSELSQARLEKDKLDFGMKEVQITLDSITDSKKEIENMNEDLKSQLESIKVDFEQYKADYDAQNAELIDLKDKLQKSRSNIDKLANLAAVNGASQGTKSLDDVIESTSRSLNNEIINLRSQIKMLYVSETTKENQINQLRGDNIELLRKFSEVESQYNKLMSEYEEFLEGSIAADEEQSKNESNSVDEIRVKLETQFKNRIDMQARELSELQEEKQRRINEINSLNELLNSERSSKSKFESELLIAKSDLENARLVAQTAQSNAYASIKNSEESKASTSSADEKESSGDESTAVSASELQDMNKKLLTKLHQVERVRHSLMRDVQNRCEKIIELELAVDDLTEKNKYLNSKIDKHEQRHKSAILEKNIAQLTLIQKELTANNSELSKNLLVMERKLQARTERISALEDHLEKLNSENEAQKRQIEEMQTQRIIENSRAKTEQSNVFTFSKLPFGRIGKPIKGGGGGMRTTRDGNKTVVRLGNNEVKSPMMDGSGTEALANGRRNIAGDESQYPYDGEKEIDQSDDYSEVFDRLSADPKNRDVVLSKLDGTVVKQKGDDFLEEQMHDAVLLMQDASKLVNSLYKENKEYEGPEYLKASIYADEKTINFVPFEDMMLTVYSSK
ncbi:hypothetical protein BB560_004284 [Smittium megazygosporum]|uniref:Kinesin motor domain-containing protein n=1 Tax=Smittium megazygosporum TaxID=133381 RepID=A0A2T9Z9N2_9FUNG|nr:hypothetical protein BB560_004284 [Smittium megazygosporum]